MFIESATGRYVEVPTSVSLRNYLGLSPKTIIQNRPNHTVYKVSDSTEIVVATFDKLRIFENLEEYNYDCWRQMMAIRRKASRRYLTGR